MYRLYEYTWEDPRRRNVILSALVVLLTLSIELYFLFYPFSEVEKLGNWLAVTPDVLGNQYSLGLILINIPVWIAMFFFAIVLVGNVKDYLRSELHLHEIIAIAAIIGLFAGIAQGIFVFAGYVIGVLAIFYFLYLKAAKNQ